MSFGGFLKQSTAVDVLIGPFVDSTDGDTEETGLTIARADVLLSKNGQTAVQKTDVTAAAHDADGFYNCELDATDSDTVGQLVLYVHVAGALAVRHDFQIVEEEPYDDIFAASAVGYLKPTVAGRDFDVSAGGEGGVDWANVGSPTTAVDLSGTDIQLVDTATAVTNDVGLTAGAVDDVWDEVLTGATHNVTNSSGRRLREVGDFGTYSNASLYLDTVNGTAGTTVGENGTDRQPSDTIANANTLLSSAGLAKVTVVGGSSVTFAAAQNNQEFLGENWTLALGGQDIGGTFFEGATVSGTGTGTTLAVFSRCRIGAITLNQARISACLLSDVITLNETKTYNISLCADAHDGGAVTLDYAAAGNVTVHLNGYGGDMLIKNMSAGDEFECAMTGTLTIDSTNTGGDVELHGAVKLINNGSGQTIDESANVLRVIRVDSGLSNMNMRFDTSTTAADPGSGDIRFDNATQASVTTIYISETSEAAVNLRVHFAQASVGDVIRIQDENDVQQYINFEISAALTDNTGWWTIPVTYQSHNGALFSASDTLLVSFGRDIATATEVWTSATRTLTAGGVIDGAIAAAELLNIADACLDRRLDLGTDTGGDTTTSRTWRDALRVLRNRADNVAGTLTVYEEDDVTAAFTAAISTTAGDPISQVNPT